MQLKQDKIIARVQNESRYILNLYPPPSLHTGVIGGGGGGGGEVLND